MKKVLSLSVVLVMLVLLCGCGSNAEAKPIDYGSFTMDKTYNYNETRYIKLTQFMNNDEVPVVSVDVYKAADEIIIPSIIVYTQEEFQGYCWEKDSDKFWVQIKDKGVICYTYKDGGWVVDKSAQLPDYIEVMPEQ